MAYLAGIWICFAAFAASALSRLLVVRKMRTELGLQTEASRGEGIAGRTKSANLRSPDLRSLVLQHKSQFPASKARSLSHVLLGVQLLATIAATALIVAAQFQPHSLFHLISAAR